MNSTGGPVIVLGLHLGIWCLIIPALIGFAAAGVLNLLDRRRVRAAKNGVALARRDRKATS